MDVLSQKSQLEVVPGKQSREDWLKVMTRIWGEQMQLRFMALSLIFKREKKEYAEPQNS